MPSLTTWAAFCPCGQCYPRDQNKHTAAPVKVARQQTTQEPSGTFATLPPTGRNLPPILPPELTPTHAGTLRLRNLPRPSAPTYASIRRNSPEPSGTCLRNLHQTFRNLPALASRRNSPEPSGTRLRNLHQHTPELSGTFRNPAEPTAAHHRTLWNLPEPSSGTCSCDPHRHTPELIWAEDPISLRCWGKIASTMCCSEKPRLGSQQGLRGWWWKPSDGHRLSNQQWGWNQQAGKFTTKRECWKHTIVSWEHNPDIFSNFCISLYVVVSILDVSGTVVQNKDPQVLPRLDGGRCVSSKRHVDIRSCSKHWTVAVTFMFFRRDLRR